MGYKVAIYTAIFGEKDKIKSPLGYLESPHVDYYLITDDKDLTSNVYNIIYKKPVYDDITKNARYYKIIGLDQFKDYDFVIWHDANLQVIHSKIIEITDAVADKSIAFFKHPDRDCIYDEAVKCIMLDKDNPFKIFRQVIGYYLKGIRGSIGLYETTIVVKNNDLISRPFLEFWWNELKSKSRRDQISLPYALKKFNVIPGIIKGNREQNDYAIYSKHSHDNYGFLSRNDYKRSNSFTKRIIIKLIRLLKKYFT
ncbi:uncharacterized protein DUF616 [Winogradskyella wandonensis]|uniref:Uncharacterized protein DUF616 n=1 Tax=Winogradskyella wandonensis TaxID=1442586 RepID=A0A4R1KVT2_9FLAO|nr:glycosyltransferase domain-containing protein [Winogradskyella wandonensis]TCK68827.1 uncharacterized protein DUF616 [Winogradskyella wandonensis]